jgi:hypothetical protein
MNITFQFVLNTSNSSSKEGRVLIRCNQNRKHKRISTGVAVAPKCWDKIHHKIKSSHTLVVLVGVITNKILWEWELG